MRGATPRASIAARGSLTRRLAALTALWVAIGLGLLGWYVVRKDEQQIETATDARLTSLLDAVVAVVSFDPLSGPILLRSLADPEFERPLSGHYWQIHGPGGTIATSRSLWDSRLHSPLPAGEGIRARDMDGPREEKLRVLERDVTISGRTGQVPLTVQVAVPRDAMEAEIARLRHQMILAFFVLGSGLVAAVALLVIWGLRPLRRTQEELVEVRQGRRLHMDIAAPSEIAPLVAEIEALIEQNRATVERARHHVGNLAHAMKTPIAVLRNAVEAEDLGMVRGQVATLERLVQHHLRRARAGALAGSAGAECAPYALAGALATALGRLSASRGIRLRVTGEEGARVRADSQDVTEMLGNLMENACKYGRTQVLVTVAPAGEGSISVAVEDDGEGLEEGEDGAALARGVRLDEAKPGSGLGLAIVSDLVALYGGSLLLGHSGRLGGLRAEVTLPGRVVGGRYEGPD
ncbi:sensor histidine kinase [Sabulicella rubraurantiaca]|uniref:sensor histidine kinase n=1 Tax=Sabulicella rubraurantiaca TaxID=2811429 RepID=UPI001A96FED6|nr:HAMP domain-containing sensor histidine kinase [Sabulicella rubraurantiaca]